MDLSSKVEKDFYIRYSENLLSYEETITFKYPEPSTFKKEKYDWYILVALEKADKVAEDRHLLTRDLLLSYRWAIREGYQHRLDPSLRGEFDYPRNRNTIKGILGYIDKIKKASDAEIRSL